MKTAGAALLAALAVGAALRVSRRPVAPVAIQPASAERTEAPPTPPSRPGFAVVPSKDRAPESQEPLTPPEIHVEVEIGKATERGPAPGPEPLVPPVVDLGTIEFGRGARPTAEPLVPPVIVVAPEELEGPSPKR